MLETNDKNTKLSVLEFDSKNLASVFLKSDYYKNYLLSDSFNESLKLFLQAKLQISLSDSEMNDARKLFMKEIAAFYESKV